MTTTLTTDECKLVPTQFRDDLGCEIFRAFDGWCFQFRFGAPVGPFDTAREAEIAAQHQALNP